MTLWTRRVNRDTESSLCRYRMRQRHTPAGVACVGSKMLCISRLANRSAPAVDGLIGRFARINQECTRRDLLLRRLRLRGQIGGVLILFLTVRLRDVSRFRLLLG